MRRNQAQSGQDHLRQDDSMTYLSRTRLRRQNHNNHIVTLILVSVIILIAVFALVYGISDDSWQRGIHRARTHFIDHKSHHRQLRHSKSKKVHPVKPANDQSNQISGDNHTFSDRSGSSTSPTVRHTQNSGSDGSGHVNRGPSPTNTKKPEKKPTSPKTPASS